jgi:hypothetical protein
VVLARGFNVDTGNAQGPGKAGNTPATAVIGIVVFAMALYVAVRFRPDAHEALPTSLPNHEGSSDNK